MTKLVVLVDGIVSAFSKRLTPDVTWNLYCAWLEQRRPDLRVCHLKQPYDWVDILSEQAETYQELLVDMHCKLQADLRVGGIPDEIIFLGFSMGGLSALSIASEWKAIAGGCPKQLTFITFGTPYAGATLFDNLFANVHISYVKRVFNLQKTKHDAKQLVGFAKTCRLSVLAHSIVGDEMVNEQSARVIGDWFYFTPESPNLRFGSYSFNPQTIFRPHNSLMQNPLLFSYVDGLLDGFLPQSDEPTSYFPPGVKEMITLKKKFRH